MLKNDDLGAEILKIRNNRNLSFFDLVSIDNVKVSDLDLIFDIARVFRQAKTKKFDFGKDKSLINVFFESSTRTQGSFDLAGKHLSMDVTSIGSGSSSKKGESLVDMAQVLNSYSPSIITIRTEKSGIPHQISKFVSAGIISAGDGWHQHPTQGILDTLTILDSFKIKNLKNLKIAIVGDILHSRVFGSLFRILKKLDCQDIRVAAPETFFPEQITSFGIKKFYKVEEALKNVDVVYTLRVQSERGANGDIPTLREYSKQFGINFDRLSLAKKNAILMHPGPVIRDLDIHSSLEIRDKRSKILQQVENGLAVRKAILYLLSNRTDNKIKKFEKI